MRYLQLGQCIVLCWVPSHVGIAGNEKAGSLPASLSKLEKSSVCLPYRDFNSHIGIDKTTMADGMGSRSAKQALVDKTHAKR